MSSKRKRKGGGPPLDELRRIYQEAWDEGIWIKEWAPGEGGKHLACAGSVSDLEAIEKRIGRELDIEKDIGLGDAVNISLPGSGETREEACRAAVAAWRAHLAERGS